MFQEYWEIESKILLKLDHDYIELIRSKDQPTRHSNLSQKIIFRVETKGIEFADLVSLNQSTVDPLNFYLTDHLTSVNDHLELHLNNFNTLLEPYHLYMNSNLINFLKQIFFELFLITNKK
jgi:hypothetical protein